MGDFNAKIGTDQNTWSPAMGRFGLGKINERGKKLLDSVCSTSSQCRHTFPDKDCRKVTWTSPCRKYKNMIDFIITQQENLTTFKNCRSYCSADVGSDHNLVLAKVLSAPVKVKLLKTAPKIYDVSRLHNSLIAEEFRANIGGAFEPQLHLEDTDVETLWEKLKKKTQKSHGRNSRFPAEETGERPAEEVRKMCHLRRKARVEMLNNPTAANKNNYKKFNKKVKYENPRYCRKTTSVRSSADSEPPEEQQMPSSQSARSLKKPKRGKYRFTGTLWTSKAFDTIWREALWKCLRSIGVDPKLVDLIARINVPSMEEDVKRRIRLASWAFGRLKNTIWSNHDITRSLKVRIYQALILPIATYSSESWALREKDRHRLDVFEMRCLRAIRVSPS
ncbi:putative craniofacial development protein 2-like [Apostichopus japonicus]|uniref:Putative craniofacial development protein 2-like n=1 Tax=Stichopus japonicus TaxID=307972 RepID=A0A2G8JXP0_STIJA|nr:putative craniofacial development protein 2-like [Apostichopus japonicus]